MKRRDRVGRGLVILGVVIAGSLGVLALVGAAVSIVDPGFQTYGIEVGPTLVLLVAVLVAYVFLLVQMLRGVVAALGCGGLFGLFMAVVGFGWVLAAGERTAAFDVAYLLAVAAGGFALALGALLRLLARRAPPPA